MISNFCVQKAHGRRLGPRPNCAACAACILNEWHPATMWPKENWSLHVATLPLHSSGYEGRDLRYTWLRRYAMNQYKGSNNFMGQFSQSCRGMEISRNIFQLSAIEQVTSQRWYMRQFGWWLYSGNFLVLRKLNVCLKEHVVLDWSSWSLKSVCNRLI